VLIFEVVCAGRTCDLAVARTLNLMLTMTVIMLVPWDLTWSLNLMVAEGLILTMTVNLMLAEGLILTWSLSRTRGWGKCLTLANHSIPSINLLLNLGSDNGCVLRGLLYDGLCVQPLHRPLPLADLDNLSCFTKLLLNTCRGI